MALPNTNISVAMVKAELGAATNNVGQLCIHPNVNKWSKWKPVRHPSKGGLTESDLKAVNFGISILPLFNIESLISHYNNIGNDWEYLKPLGAESSPYRLGDFRGYDGLAERFYYFNDLPNNVFVNDNMITIRMRNYANRPNLTFELLGLDEFYFGAYIVKQDNPAYYMQKTMNTPVGYDNILDIEFLNNQSIGEYNVYTYLALKVDGNPFNYYPLDGGFLGSLLITQKVQALTVDLTGDLMAGVLNWSLDISNERIDEFITLFNVYITARYGDNVMNVDPLENGETQISLGDLTITPSGYSNNGSFFGALPEYDTRGGYLYFSHSSGGDKNYSDKYPI